MSYRILMSLDEIRQAKSGDWLSGGGECCGFDVYIENDCVIWENRVCGKGLVESGTFSLSLLKSTAAKIDEKSLIFDEWGEAGRPINDKIEFTFDKHEPGIFNLRRI